MLICWQPMRAGGLACAAVVATIAGSCGRVGFNGLVPSDGAAEWDGADVDGTDDDADLDAAELDAAGLDAAALPRIIQVEAGTQHSCALWDDGKLKCWGANGLGQLGLGDTTHRGDTAGEMGLNLPFVDLGDWIATSVSAGINHTCVVAHLAAAPSTHRVLCWGANNAGQLGLGDTSPRGVRPGQMGNALVPVDLAGGNAMSIHAGGSQTCAITIGGSGSELRCWGGNAEGQLGIGSANNFGDGAGETVPAPALQGLDFAAVATSNTHTCEVASSQVRCWGNGAAGALGTGATDIIGNDPGETGGALPIIDVDPGAGVSAVSTSASISCALLLNQLVKCWGSNNAGQLGLGDTNPRGDQAGEMGASLPTIDLGGSASAISTSGGIHVCALLGTQIKCWGQNDQGQLGLEDLAARGDQPGEMGVALPAVDLGEAATQMSTGARHTCALLASGSVKCWGDNNLGQLGIGEGDVTPRGDAPGEMGTALPAVDLTR
jgi:alpha-tubulin suppressor-like RCC1 family protein